MKQAREGGFTMVEVMVAMVILAVGLLGLEALGIGAIRSVSLADQNSRAAAIATAHLEDAIQRIHRSDIPPSCLDQPLAGGDRLTREVVISNDPAEPHRVVVTVVPEPRGGAERPYTLATHVFAVTTTGVSPDSIC